MSIDPLVFFDLVIAVCLLSLASVTLAISFAKIARELNSSKKERDSLFEQMHKKESVLLEEARIKAAKITEEANLKAQEILESANSLGSESKKMLEDALESLVKHQTTYFEKVSEDFLKTYQEELDLLRAKNIEIVKSASKNIEEDATKEVKDFDSVVERETVASQKIIEERIEAEYARVQKEVEEYKNQMLKKVDEQIYRIIEEVSKQVIGKGLSLAQHEQLVIDALNTAKRNGMR